MKTPILLLVLSSALPLSARAASEPAPSSLSTLLNRVSNYLNSEPVRRARVTAAVFAVRGGIPKDQGEDLDQRLLDRASTLRGRLLSASPSPDDEASLRQIYGALAVSQWTQALAKDPNGAEAKAALSQWAQALHSPEVPDDLKALLQGGGAIDDKALVQSGWGAYCRALTPALADLSTATPVNAAAPDTLRLDELLTSLQRTWTGKTLAADEEAQAHFLAGNIYAELAKADLKGGPAAQSSAAAQPAPEFVPKTIYANAAKAVVLILGASADGGGELGSGSIIDASGQILTNAHVVIRDSTREPWPIIRVYLKPAKMTGDPKQDMVNPIPARVVAFDPSLDLALLDLVSTPGALPTLSLGSPDSVQIGDQVAAIGHPEQGGLWTLTTGVVSTVVADLGGVAGKNAFQTDASINRGNSGGPLLNAAGEIIGVNTLMSRKAADGLAITSVNFALKSDVARNWLAQSGNAPGVSPAAVAPAQAQAQAQAAPAEPAKPKAQRVTISESRPYKKESLIDAEIKDMENLEDELHQEFLKKSGTLKP